MSIRVTKFHKSPEIQSQFVIEFELGPETKDPDWFELKQHNEDNSSIELAVTIDSVTKLSLSTWRLTISNLDITLPIDTPLGTIELPQLTPYPSDQQESETSPHNYFSDPLIKIAETKKKQSSKNNEISNSKGSFPRRLLHNEMKSDKKTTDHTTEDKRNISNKLIPLTFPFVRGIFWKWRYVLLGLGLVSVLQGVAPTLKSELESGLISQINDELISQKVKSTKQSISTVLSQPVIRLQRKPEGTDQALPERIALTLFSGASVIAALGWYFVIAFVVIVLEVAATKATARITKAIYACLRSEGLKKALATDPHQVESISNAAGEYTSAIHMGAGNAQQTYSYFLEAGQQVFSLVIIVSLIATKSAWFATCCLFIVSMQALICFIQAKHLRTSRQKLDSSRNSLLARTDDILSKRDILVAHEQQDVYSEKIDSYTNEMAELNRQLTVREAIYRGLSSLISDYGKILLLTLALILTLVISGDAIGDVGDAYFLASIYVRLFVPITNLLDRYDSLKRSESTSKTYLAVLAAPVNEFDSKTAIPHQFDEPINISLEDVTFSYHPDSATAPIIKNCSFTAPAGSICLILGPSGCGKTTIARLLLGFWRPSMGSIHLDGRDTKEMSGSEIRTLMSYVAQDDYIIDDTVRENLSWSDKSASSDAELIHNLVSVGIASNALDAETILEKPARFLSTGQQQRLSVARLMLDDAPIAILDEPLSGVDVFTMRDVLPHLKDALSMHQRTTLIISHRLVYASFVSHVVILGNRNPQRESQFETTVLEEGPKDVLLADQNSLFSKLYDASLNELGQIKRDNPKN